jgi:hypothetical protein
MAEENCATPLMTITVDKMEPNRISAEQTEQEKKQAEELNFKTRLGTAVTAKYPNTAVHLQKSHVFNKKTITFCDKWFPVNTAWRNFMLRMEERPPHMEGRYVYIE